MPKHRKGGRPRWTYWVFRHNGAVTAVRRTSAGAALWNVVTALDGWETATAAEYRQHRAAVRAAGGWVDEAR